MSGGLTIRPGTAADVETVHAALVRLAGHLGQANRLESRPADLLAHGFGPEPAFEVLIAEIDGAFAGLCLTLRSFSTWRGVPGVYVQDLYVEDAFRGQHIGEALLRAAARRGHARGARYMRLSVDAGNAGAKTFYERLGLTHSASEQIQTMSGEAFSAFAAEQEENR